MLFWPRPLHPEKGRCVVADQERKGRVSETLLTIALAIYVLVLMVAAVDELFDLGVFPPELEKQISQHLKQLRSADPMEQNAAEKWLIEEGHQFAVRQLIAELRDPQIQDRVGKILAQICSELDLEAQAKNAVTRMAGQAPRTQEKAAWELVEIGHFGVPAITQAMGHPRPDIRARLRRAIVLATAVYFPSPSGAATSDPWEAEKLDARAAQLVSQLANPALANGAAEELKKQPFSHFAKPRLIDALHSRELQRKAAQVLAELAEQDASQSLAQWEEWYTRTWDGWYKKEKDRLGFGTDYSKWKLWYRMNKDHL